MNCRASGPMLTRATGLIAFAWRPWVIDTVKIVLTINEQRLRTSSRSDMFSS